MWKLDSNSLMNKAKVWTSKDDWDLIENETSVCIQNKTTEKVLTITDSGEEVTEDTMVPFKSSQMWAKGEPNKDGYFTLTSIDSRQLLTANSALCLTIEGKNSICSPVLSTVYRDALPFTLTSKNLSSSLF